LEVMVSFNLVMTETIFVVLCEIVFGIGSNTIFIEFCP